VVLEYLFTVTNVFALNSRVFATGIATLFAFILAMVLFPFYITFLRSLQFSSELQNSSSKTPEPVMPAGILFLVVIVLTTLIAVRFNTYVISALAIYVFFSIIGAIDDIAKVFNKRRLARGEISKEDYQYKTDGISASLRLTLYLIISFAVAIAAYKFIPNIDGKIVIPFLSIEKTFPHLPFWVFIPFMALTIAVMANGVNFTDGFDTLSTVPLLTCSVFVGVIAYVSSNQTWADYLLLPTIAGIEEILPLVGAVVGTLLAFLWYNSPPSSIIMGDSGSVGLGGLIGILFIFIKAGFYLPIVGFIFLIEFISVILQIGYFKLSGGKRIFLCAPIHHHFQFKMRKNPLRGDNFAIKAKITWRFHILSVILLITGLILYIKVR